MSTKRVFTGASWEKRVGYCRAVRRGAHITISGTAPITEDGKVFEPGHPYAQTKRCLAIINQALEKLGASMSDVVRTRMYVTDISRWAEYGQAHAEAFADFPPATSMLEIQSLIEPGMMIEIEADAIAE